MFQISSIYKSCKLDNRAKMLACVHNTTEPGCLQNERRRHKPNKTVSGRIRKEERDEVKQKVKDDVDGHLIYKSGDTLEHRCTNSVLFVSYSERG